MYQEDAPQKHNSSPPPHYYGDSVRAPMILGGVVMMGTFPFFTDLIPGPLFFPVIAMLVLAIFGGLMNPQQKWIVVLNVGITAAAFLIFEHQAMVASRTLGFRDAFFITNQTLALIFFVAVYYATKTVRAMYLGR